MNLAKSLNFKLLSRVVQKSFEYKEKESKEVDESIECEWYVCI